MGLRLRTILLTASSDQTNIISFQSKHKNYRQMRNKKTSKDIDWLMFVLILRSSIKFN